MRKLLILIGLLLAALFSASAQTGTWSGKIEVQGVKLPLVFHLTEDNPTMDSPDQGARDIPITVERNDTGKNDALAGIQLLRERFDRVGVIGHSEGGTIALLLAAERKADAIDRKV